MNKIFEDKINKVKVYASCTDDNGQQTPLDMGKIKVSVIVTTPSPKKSQLVVSLIRLTDDEISKYTDASKQTNAPKQTNASKPNLEERKLPKSNVMASSSKREGESGSTISTRSKTKLSKDTDRSTTSSNASASSSKREGESGSTISTRSKTQPSKNSDQATSSTTKTPATLKRKNDVECSKLTVSKKQKTSNDLPASDIIEIKNTVAVAKFKIGEIVWAKIKGWPHWPCKILNFDGKKYQVEWCNDYRTTKIFHTQMFTFLPNFQKFSVEFPKSIGLETAAKEGLICIAQQSK